MQLFTPLVVTLSQTLLLAPLTRAITIDVNDPNSFKQGAATVASDMMTFYADRDSKLIPGKFDGTWWEGGAMFMGLMQYWHWTGDATWNEQVNSGMVWQAGPNGDFFTSNYSSYLGNDDQAFWGLAAITAAELNYPAVADAPSWLSMAQAVFNEQASRWDDTTCKGGLRWQIYPIQSGYRIKNAISNGALFQIAARLARYTGNQTYSDWAEKIWDWSATTPLLNTSEWHIADTTTPATDCTDHGDIQWTYNYGTYLMGAAYMYNFTNAGTKWKNGVDGLLAKTISLFFPSEYGGKVMSEVACESIDTCDRNQICFKGFLSAWLATTTQLVPYTLGEIKPLLQGSAVAAGKQCTGLSDDAHCGIQWYNPTWDRSSGIEQQMAVLGIFSNNLVFFDGSSSSPNSNYTAPKQPAPLTAGSGGNSTSNPGAGASEAPFDPNAGLMNIGTADRAGAGVLTGVFGLAWIGMLIWIAKDVGE
ncbi:putative glycosyl hydrolase [Talaromyces proteolyticus]|uniref:Mannan endo-1,6-alpha-mannosidase n=1 Tax=Talaromyces proteolyticus TaxID=1131652 RepID=A0AAD4KXA5_9EURO|nr:putative glycosyl hydrolase [Talaromyces proteolyticus]KAH8703241.1 putative glycosyl hydrolase [Talaromyces proteolyticus]